MAKNECEHPDVPDLWCWCSPPMRSGSVCCCCGHQPDVKIWNGWQMARCIWIPDRRLTLTTCVAHSLIDRSMRPIGSHSKLHNIIHFFGIKCCLEYHCYDVLKNQKVEEKAQDDKYATMHRHTLTLLAAHSCRHHAPFLRLRVPFLMLYTSHHSWCR